ncbi:TetR family transcriptional regulator [Anaerocolumna cellulosilytica]|uniref:TetR family transcriptional regulator n=1 Tax=Anaerocolumna cellulosilytica TaxID=433286 RepID=A0A6S6R1E4_9FIRM|nr:TetR/AcrR family transcriptional regulator [Anaerocolumna cellulosilytica]MBB5195643.1 AcrR family transcriptional regulator [Anaerocolumna cellulosilytica]BCJ93887.1 TetR family transcriptional regulator [Anaerocolumna cellulosilytica]
MSNYQLFIPTTSKHYSNKETNRLTREAICTALILLIKEQPFLKITITDIVKRAGVSRTAYYSNYNSKQDILVDLVDSLIYEINQKLLPYTDEKTGKAKAPKQFIQVLFEVLYKQRDIYITLLDAQFHNIILDRMNDIMLQHARDKSDNNIYRVYFNAGALYNVFTKWIQSKSLKTVDEMTEICLRMYHTPMSQE